MSKELFHALKNEQKEEAYSLLRQVEKVTGLTDEWGKTSLHYALSIRDEDVTAPGALNKYNFQSAPDLAKKIINKMDLNALNQPDFQCITALTLAIDKGYQDVVDLLLEKKVKPDIATVTTNSSLHYALFYKEDIHLAIKLIDMGANILVSNNGENALHYAARNNNAELAEHNKNLADIRNARKSEPKQKELAEKYTKLAEKHKKLAEKHKELVKKLLDKAEALPNKEDYINAKDPEGFTPLHYAVKLGRVDVVQFLTDHNADVNCTDKKGKTASYYIYCSTHLRRDPVKHAQGVEILKILKNHKSGAKILTPVEDVTPKSNASEAIKEKVMPADDTASEKDVASVVASQVQQDATDTIAVTTASESPICYTPEQVTDPEGMLLMGTPTDVA